MVVSTRYRLASLILCIGLSACLPDRIDDYYQPSAASGTTKQPLGSGGGPRLIIAFPSTGPNKSVQVWLRVQGAPGSKTVLNFSVVKQLDIPWIGIFPSVEAQKKRGAQYQTDARLLVRVELNSSEIQVGAGGKFQSITFHLPNGMLKQEFTDGVIGEDILLPNNLGNQFTVDMPGIVIDGAPLNIPRITFTRGSGTFMIDPL
jgi:hypothetical protein